MFYILKVCLKLIWRGTIHDLSKFGLTEAPIFSQHLSKLKKVEFGTVEYDNMKTDLRTALDHHYKHNRHHPEHFKNKIHDMSLIDVVEMFCDWEAAIKRTKKGDIIHSIHVMTNKLNLDLQVAEMLENEIKPKK